MFLGTSRAQADEDAGFCGPPVALPPAGPIPANLPGFVLVRYADDATQVLLLRLAADGTEVVVPTTVSMRTSPSRGAVDVLITPSSPLLAGERYALRPATCFAGGPRTWPDFVYEVGPTASPPSSLGTVQFAPLQRLTGEGWVWYLSSVSVQASAADAAWASLYELTFSVTGSDAVVQDLSTVWVVPPQAVLQVTCPDSTAPGRIPPGLTTGHAVGVGYFGGTLTADGMTTYACADVIDVDAGVATTRDGGIVPPDAGAATGGGGCCAVAGVSVESDTGWVAIVVALAITVRRRRTAR